MKAGFVLNGLRSIVASIDSAIYYIISLLYDILGSLTNFELFSQDQIYEFSALLNAFKLVTKAYFIEYIQYAFYFLF